MHCTRPKFQLKTFRIEFVIPLTYHTFKGKHNCVHVRHVSNKPLPSNTPGCIYMALVQADRKRAALSTVGKGSRGLVGFWDLSRPVVITGTATARTENALHVLEFDRNDNRLIVRGIVRSPAEVWSLQLHNDQGQVGPVVVAARRGLQSAVEIWSLTGITDLLDHAGETHSTSPFVERVSAMTVDGLILRARQSPYSSATCLSLMQMEAAVIETERSSLRLKMRLPLDSKGFARDDTTAKLVDGDWIDINTVMLANQHGLGIFDMRTGQLESSMSLRVIVERSRSAAEGFRISPHPSRLSSVCCSKIEAYVLCGGCEDGTVRAFDIRSNDLLWQAKHAKNQWVSTVHGAAQGGVISGGTDGVVKCWGVDGGAVATFPQHDDTVTNVCCSAQNFATVSYDGRVAVNEMPVDM